jgi:hypothetical protein
MSKKAEAGIQPMSIEKLLEIEERLRILTELGAPTVIPSRLVPDAIARKVAHAMARHPEIPDSNYIVELSKDPFSRTTVQRIVKRARNLASTVVAAPVLTDVPAPVANTAASQSNTPAVPTQKKVKHKRGDSLWRNYHELFKGYEKHDYKRPMSADNPKGTYLAEVREIQKYGSLWAAVGFQMVPEDLPKILPAVKETGLLDVYKVDPALVREIEEEGRKMIAAGVDMRLVPTTENADQIGDDPIIN